MPDWDAVIEALAKDFSQSAKSNPLMLTTSRTLRKGNATYATASSYARGIANSLAKSMHSMLAGLDVDYIPEDVLNRMLSQLLGESYKSTSQFASQVQQALNDQLHVRITPQVPPMNTDKVTGLAKHLSELDTDHISDVIDKELSNFTASIVDDTIKANTEFIGDAGLYVGLQRIAEPHCCEFCEELEGEYTLDEIKTNRDIFARHVGCQCQLVPIFSDGLRGGSMRTSGNAFVRG